MTFRGFSCAALLGMCAVAAGYAGAAPAAAAFPGEDRPAAITAGAVPGEAAWGLRAARPSARASLPSRGAAITAALIRAALRYVGRPYRWAGIGRGGFDCSGLVLRVFSAIGIAMPHSSSGQYRAGTVVPAALLGPGDLVFFHTSNSGPSHVGIYLGAGRFVHASYSRGVIVSSMHEPYYAARYLGARRY